MSMNMTDARPCGRPCGWRWGTALLALVWLSSACISTSTFTTARALDPGESSHTVAIEGFAFLGNPTCDSGDCGTNNEVIPIPMPSYIYRRGMVEELELSLKARPSIFANEVAVGVKFNPIQGDTFDLALEPTAHVFFGVDEFLGSVPFAVGASGQLMLDLHLTPEADLTLQGGPMALGDFGNFNAFYTVGLGARVSLGDWGSIHPEVRWLGAGVPGNGGIVSAGLGITFGGPGAR